jgi:phosphotransferase system IIB component
MSEFIKALEEKPARIRFSLENKKIVTLNDLKNRNNVDLKIDFTDVVCLYRF